MASKMVKKFNKQYYKNYLPPLLGQVPTDQSGLATKSPFKGAETWQCSHFYFWWEYLRRHEGYKRCCKRGGKGSYSKLFNDFGDVHTDDYLTWWYKKQNLFVSKNGSIFSTTDPKYEHLPLSKQKCYFEIFFDKGTIKTIRELIDFRHYISYIKIKTDNEPKYGIESRVPLRTLWEHLKVWDAKLANPMLHDSEIADIAGILVSERVNGETVAKLKALDLPYGDIAKIVKRRKQLAVQRHLRIAEQYIHNVGRGKFPLRKGR